jgi:hypothetical protein
MNFHEMANLLLLAVATVFIAARLTESSRSLQGGGVPLSISLPVAGKGKTDLLALKCSVLGKFGVSASFCRDQVCLCARSSCSWFPMNTSAH